MNDSTEVLILDFAFDELVRSWHSSRVSATTPYREEERNAEKCDDLLAEANPQVAPIALVYFPRVARGDTSLITICVSCIIPPPPTP